MTRSRCLRYPGVVVVAMLVSVSGCRHPAQQEPVNAVVTAGVWHPVESPTRAALRGLCVTGSTVAWASGSQGTFLRTVDQGRHWQAGAVAGAEDRELRDIHCWDQQRALVLSAGSPATIYRTKDGGHTWALTYDNQDPGIFFNAMAFWDDRQGIAVADPIDGSFVVIITRDGGKSWQPVPAEALPPALAGEANFAASGTCLFVLPGSELVWFGTGGPAARVFRSADRGASWTVAETPLRAGEPSQGVFSLYFVDESNGVAVGGDYQDEGNPAANAAVTSDGGTTWSLVLSPPAGFRECVIPMARAHSPEVLITVGPSGSDISYDRGRTWSPAGTLPLHAAGFSDSGDTGWAVGADGVIAQWSRSGRSPDPTARSPEPAT